MTLLSSRQLKRRIKVEHKEYYELTHNRIVDKPGYDLAIFCARMIEKLNRVMV